MIASELAASIDGAQRPYVGRIDDPTTPKSMAAVIGRLFDPVIEVTLVEYDEATHMVTYSVELRLRTIVIDLTLDPA